MSDADPIAAEPNEDLDDSKAPLLDHLIELRRRLLWSFATFVGAFFVCFYFAEPIFAFLVQPLLRRPINLTKIGINCTRTLPGARP